MYIMDKPDAQVETWLTDSKPSSFAIGADVVLVLTDDDSKELRAHSAILAAQSQVLCELFYRSGCEATGRGEDGKATWRVPVPDATLKQATSFLEYLYWQGRPGYSEFDVEMDDVHSMTELLHRFDCKLALQKLDVYLAWGADFNLYEGQDSLKVSP